MGKQDYVYRHREFLSDDQDAPFINAFIEAGEDAATGFTISNGYDVLSLIHYQFLDDHADETLALFRGIYRVFGDYLAHLEVCVANRGAATVTRDSAEIVTLTVNAASETGQTP